MSMDTTTGISSPTRSPAPPPPTTATAAAAPPPTPPPPPAAQAPTPPPTQPQPPPRPPAAAARVATAGAAAVARGPAATPAAATTLEAAAAAGATAGAAAARPHQGGGAPPPRHRPAPATATTAATTAAATAAQAAGVAAASDAGARAGPREEERGTGTGTETGTGTGTGKGAGIATQSPLAQPYHLAPLLDPPPPSLQLVNSLPSYSTSTLTGNMQSSLPHKKQMGLRSPLSSEPPQQPPSSQPLQQNLAPQNAPPEIPEWQQNALPPATQPEPIPSFIDNPPAFLSLSTQFPPAPPFPSQQLATSQQEPPLQHQPTTCTKTGPGELNCIPLHSVTAQSPATTPDIWGLPTQQDETQVTSTTLRLHTHQDETQVANSQGFQTPPTQSFQPTMPLPNSGDTENLHSDQVPCIEQQIPALLPASSQQTYDQPIASKEQPQLEKLLQSRPESVESAELPLPSVDQSDQTERRNVSTLCEGESGYIAETSKSEEPRKRPGKPQHDVVQSKKRRRVVQPPATRTNSTSRKIPKKKLLWNRSQVGPKLKKKRVPPPSALVPSGNVVFDNSQLEELANIGQAEKAKWEKESPVSGSAPTIYDILAEVSALKFHCMIVADLFTPTQLLSIARSLVGNTKAYSEPMNPYELSRIVCGLCASTLRGDSEDPSVRKANTYRFFLWPETPTEVLVEFLAVSLKRGYTKTARRLLRELRSRVCNAANDIEIDVDSVLVSACKAREVDVLKMLIELSDDGFIIPYKLEEVIASCDTADSLKVLLAKVLPPGFLCCGSSSNECLDPVNVSELTKQCEPSVLPTLTSTVCSEKRSELCVIACTNILGHSSSPQVDLLEFISSLSPPPAPDELEAVILECVLHHHYEIALKIADNNSALLLCVLRAGFQHLLPCQLDVFLSCISRKLGPLTKETLADKPVTLAACLSHSEENLILALEYGSPVDGDGGWRSWPLFCVSCFSNARQALRFTEILLTFGARTQLDGFPDLLTLMCNHRGIPCPEHLSLLVSRGLSPYSYDSAGKLQSVIDVAVARPLQFYDLWRTTTSLIASGFDHNTAPVVQQLLQTAPDTNTKAEVARDAELATKKCQQAQSKHQQRPRESDAVVTPSHPLQQPGHEHEPDAPAVTTSTTPSPPSPPSPPLQSHSHPLISAFITPPHSPTSPTTNTTITTTSTTITTPSTQNNNS
ncbi:hypothetical protein Pelo_1596 [Pelomyxa schiedti]|nr:hypothetical protein Pelo_1596 [Pelomyxa schiedti]